MKSVTKKVSNDAKEQINNLFVSAYYRKGEQAVWGKVYNSVLREVWWPVRWQVWRQVVNLSKKFIKIKNNR